MPKTYTLSEVRNRHGEVFDRAIKEPVFVTKQDRPSHVIMAYDRYVDAVARNVEAMARLEETLAKAEDLLLGVAAEKVVASSPRVGSEAFTAALKRFADADDAEA
jgi:PHD/YefM family antitoxin component YafN of YafNO toxin-antitoxin module